MSGLLASDGRPFPCKSVIDSQFANFSIIIAYDLQKGDRGYPAL